MLFRSQHAQGLVHPSRLRRLAVLPLSSSSEYKINIDLFHSVLTLVPYRPHGDSSQLGSHPGLLAFVEGDDDLPLVARKNPQANSLLDTG